MHLPIDHYFFIFGIFFASFFIKRIAGFGDPLLTGPLLSMLLENRLISPANLLISIPINTYTAWVNRRSFSVKSTIPIALCIQAGVVPGALLLKYAASRALKIGLGLVVILIGIEMLTRKKESREKGNPIVMAAACFLSGITSGLYGINLFFIAYVERSTKNRNEFRGNICFIFLIENICRGITYFLFGILSEKIVILALLGVPGVLAGMWLGGRVDSKMSEETVRVITIMIFIAAGVSIVVKSVPWTFLFH